MTEEKTKVEKLTTVPTKGVDSVTELAELQPKPTVSQKLPGKSLLTIFLVAVLILTTAVAGYFAGKKSTDQSNGLTPTQASATPTVPDTVTPTDSQCSQQPTCPSDTANCHYEVRNCQCTQLCTTPPPSETPVVSYVTKTARIKEFDNNFTLTFTLVVPSDVTVTEGKVSSWNGIILKKGAKTFMAFNLPYELYEIQGYSSVTNVASNTISNLRRVRSKKVFANSGTYSFAVAYVTPNLLLSGKDCTEPVISEATSSPCATPALAYSDTVGFSAYCSIDATYQKICDEVMKTIKVVKE